MKEQKPPLTREQFMELTKIFITQGEFEMIQFDYEGKWLEPEAFCKHWLNENAEYILDCRITDKLKIYFFDDFLGTMDEDFDEYNLSVVDMLDSLDKQVQYWKSQYDEVVNTCKEVYKTCKDIHETNKSLSKGNKDLIKLNKELFMQLHMQNEDSKKVKQNLS